jgi:exodeoxyribonuclease VII small subunit
MSDSKKAVEAANQNAGALKPATFEGSVARLGQIVERLESGELPLEESLRLFEEGVQLARATQQQLNQAERRVEQLLSIDEEGNPVVEELDPEPRE